jgi:hypothetical protein
VIAFVEATGISMRRFACASPILICLIVLAARAQPRQASVPFSHYAITTKELTHTSNSVTLEITFPDPKLDSTNGITVLRQLGEHSGVSDVLAPIALPIRASKGTQVGIVNSTSAVLKVPQNFSLPEAMTEQVLDGSPKKYVQTKLKNPPAHLGIGFVSITYLGRARAVDMSAIKIGCYDYNASTHTLRYLKKITITINDPQGITQGVALTNIREAYSANSSAFHSRLQAHTQQSGKTAKVQSVGDVQQTPGLQADDGYVYRMYVNKTGIYHITFDDLKQFNLDPSKIDPTTLRIISGGQQVPVYVFDHQNGRFEEGDYVEFFGEEKLLKYNSRYGDEYYDPYTHNNVYYLVWGSKYSSIPQGGVKRMVEESGEIREADRTKFTDLKNSSFRTRLHYEQDNVFENLDITDMNDLTSVRDHLLIGSIFTAQTMTLDTVTPYPDIEGGKPFTLRVAFQGISHFDPGTVGTHGEPLENVPNEQQPDVSLNGTHILAGIWDSQVMRFLSTDTAAQRISPGLPDPKLLKKNSLLGDSARATFPLEVTIESKVQTDEQYCQLGVNWFDLDYDRLYAAYQEQLQFSIPQSSPSGLYQFTISNFSRSDISIYRLGVSKISNIFIDASAPNQNGIKTIFQLNVASDADQFFATVDSAKLKPFKYVRDTWQDLRAVTNQGAYLIITNRDHLNKFPTSPSALQPLLDERKQKQHLSGQIIDVANIYDQFSFGCRSPQAIKDFLTYAYNSWSDPPRYVMLVGTTHPGTDDSLPGQPAEQVPTFYFQSYSYGATSTDTWYTTLDGSDLIPDLILGRLPSVTQNDDQAYVAKVLAFDNDYVAPALWKDRSLFVSGQTVTGAGVPIDFYGEIEGLLGSVVPENIGVERQGLDDDPSHKYFGDDQTLVNFWNNGLSYVHFMGHGGLGVWADVLPNSGRSLFLSTDVARLNNAAHLPFVSSLTCFTGAYDGSTQGALLPQLLLYPNGGAIGALGTSSYGFRDQDVLLAQRLLPAMFDTLPATFAERVTTGKTGFYITDDPSGNLLDPTLTLSYNYLGDPVVSPFQPADNVEVTLSTRTPQVGQSVTISGTTTIQTGRARIELMDENNAPLVPSDSQTVNVTNGAFTATDLIQSGLKAAYGSYHVTVYGATTTNFARTSADVSFTTARMTQLEFDPRPVPAGTDFTFSAVVQSPTGVGSAVAVITESTQNASGVVTTQLPFTRTMTPTNGVYSCLIPGSGLQKGMLVSAYVVLTPTTGPVDSSYSIQIIIDQAADPAAYHDPLHRSVIGKYISTPSGLAWQQNVYNWGASDAANVRAAIIDAATGLTISTQTIPDVAPHGSVAVAFPMSTVNLDTAQLELLVQPQAGTTPLNLRDSSIVNDTTTTLAVPRGAIAYSNASGTGTVTFDNGSVSVALSAGAEGPIASDVIGVTRLPARPVLQQYVNQQPDIHFAPLYTSKGIKFAGIRVVSDSLGAIPLSSATACTIMLTFNPNDSVILTKGSRQLFIYRQDDKSKQWTILPTIINQFANIATAKSQNLGNFAIAYNTDVILPTVDLSVEGQVFVAGGDVPAQPHISAVMQDADGIDITPGKTIVKVDGRVLGPSEFAMLDSLRTPTTANLHFEPSLSNGTHTLTVQATDNDGNQSIIETLAVNVSNNFVVKTLGSYPNPFSVQMFLAYQIQGIPFAQSVQLKIYTVSGRLIRTLAYPSNDPNQTFGLLKGGTGVPTSLGYHEAWWDGHDDGGSDVANGVYFYKLIVTTTSDERDITGKFARIR